MGHHSGYPFDKQMSKEELDKLFESFNQMKSPKSELGATGKFPMGKLVEHDEGEIKIGIKGYNDKVIIDFGKPTHWIGFSPEQAKQVAESLVRHAENIESQPKDEKAN